MAHLMAPRWRGQPSTSGGPPICILYEEDPLLHR